MEDPRTEPLPSIPAARADAVLKAAQAKAGREEKNVLVLFKASWCPWCRAFDRLLADPALAAAWGRSYVVAEINVRERGERKRLENPGWEGVMKRYRVRDDLDVPYLVILDPKGTKLANSIRFGESEIPANAGYPQRPEEITEFLSVIERTAKFAAEERDRLRAHLAPKG